MYYDSKQTGNVRTSSKDFMQVIHHISFECASVACYCFKEFIYWQVLTTTSYVKTFSNRNKRFDDQSLLTLLIFKFVLVFLQLNLFCVRPVIREWVGGLIDQFISL